MTGLSVNRLDRILSNDMVREEYGSGANAPRSVYRTVERLGRNSDEIVSFLGNVLKKKYGVKIDTIFMDWTSMYFEAPQKGIVRVGYFGTEGWIFRRSPSAYRLTVNPECLSDSQ